VISNTAIEIVSTTEARHHSHWQTIRIGPDNQITVGAIGRYDDVIVKRNGRWLIQSRKIAPFTN
jgi:3-phenylpropionate/cinnamic acid dioxygenase small subunit